MSEPRVLVLDHLDSFVFILAEQFACLGCAMRTLRSDLSLAQLQEHLAEFRPDLVLLSPGPGRPEEAGVTVEWLRTEPEVPVLGICLGLQALAVANGGVVDRAPQPVHGRACSVRLLEDPVFDGLPPGFWAARYHSLVVTKVPSCMRVIASVEDRGQELVMALRHNRLPQVGLQFHPESVLTPWGGKLLERILHLACDRRRAQTQTIHTQP